MNATDIAVIAVILIIIGLALYYIIKEKKRGKRCIGCPSGGCNGGCSGCGCSGACTSAHTECECDGSGGAEEDESNSKM